MKRTIYTLTLLTLSTITFAQFTSSGADLYHTGGKVGIGTSSPTLAPLHISANTNLVQIRLERTGTLSGISADIGGANGNLIFYPGGYSNKNGNVYFNTTGKVGIGTESPEDILHIFSPGVNGSRVTSLLIDGYTQNTLVNGSSQVIRFKGNAERYWGAIGGYTANSKEGMGIFAGTSTSLTTTPGIYLNSDQKVGIGTTDPSYALDVSSSSADISFRIEDGVSGAPIRLRSFGNGQAFLYMGSEASSINRSGGDFRFWANGKDMAFSTDNGSSNHMFINTSGNVGIGITTPAEKLEVNGTIRSKRVKVEATGWPDYVFAPSYELRALSEVESYIKAKGHLPEVPSAKEIEEKGLDLGAMDATLLKKVEELTLYLIEMKKEIEELKKENKELKSTFAKTSKNK